MISNRRSFILGAASLLAAPAIVRADSLMKIVVPKRMTPNEIFAELMDRNIAAMAEIYEQTLFYGTSLWATEDTGLMRALRPEEWPELA